MSGILLKGGNMSTPLFLCFFYLVSYRPPFSKPGLNKLASVLGNYGVKIEK